jgi:hypothetical protein
MTTNALKDQNVSENHVLKLVVEVQVNVQQKVVHILENPVSFHLNTEE